MTNSNANAGRGDAAGGLLLVLLALIPWIAIFILPVNGLVPGMTPGVVMAVAIAFLAIPSAVLSASIHAGVRHAYLLHYAVLMGLLSVSLSLPLLRLAPMSTTTFAVCVAGMAGAGAWAVASVMAAAASTPRGALLIATAAISVALGLMRIGLFLFPIVLLAVLAGTVALLFPRPGTACPAAKPSASAAALSFVVLNVILAAGLVPLGVPFYLHFMTLDPAPSMTLGEFLARLGHTDGILVPQESFPGIALFLRWGLGVAGLGIGAAAVYLWPKRPAGRWRVFPGLVGLLGAACATGSTVPAIAMASAGASVAGILAGGILASHTARSERMPYALVGSAIGGTILLQAQAIFYKDDILLPGAVWLVEAGGLFLVWCIAYLFGIRIIRRRSDTALSRLPGGGTSSPDEPPGQGAPAQAHGSTYPRSPRI